MANDYHDKLLEAVNAASASARRSWIFFLALMAYFTIAITSVTHQQLLLDTPILLPLLQVPMPITAFFMFSPMILFGIHVILLLQHAALAEKVFSWDQSLAQYEGRERFADEKVKALRQSLSIYFYTQAVSNVKGDLFVTFIRNVLMWTTMTLLPLLLILYFQAAFLPYHDSPVTWVHRGIAVLDLGLLVGMVWFSRFDNLVGRDKKLGNWFVRGLFFVCWLVLALSSVFALTIPDSPLDKKMASFEWASTKVPMGLKDWQWKAKGSRYAFWPTAYLFEGQIDYSSGKSRSLFSRSLVVPDQQIVPDRDYKDKETSLSLRGRDLRYATFDRSGLRNVDFTAANMQYISMKGTDLRYSRFGCADMGRAPEWLPKRKPKKGKEKRKQKPKDEPGSKKEIDKKAGKKTQTKRCSTFFAANLSGANLSNAQIREASFERANLVGANLTEADLRKSLLWSANLTFADLTSANLDWAGMKNSKLVGAVLNQASLIGTYLPASGLEYADFGDAHLWWTRLPNVKELNHTSFGESEEYAPSEKDDEKERKRKEEARIAAEKEREEQVRKSWKFLQNAGANFQKWRGKYKVLDVRAGWVDPADIQT